MDEVGLGRQLQEARKKAGLTQQELCQKAAISYSTLAKIERGAIKAPSVFTISSIADVLGIPLDDLLGRHAAPTLPPVIPKKVSKSGIRFIYFDVNGCLVRFFHHAFSRISEEYNISPDIVEAAFWRFNNAACRGEITMTEFNASFSAELGIEIIDWTQYYMDEISPVADMQDLLNWAAEHYRVGLLTNIMPGFINEMLLRQLLPDVDYTAIVDSSQIGSIKPEDAIFDEAEARSNCQPAELLLIDDSRTNIIAAQQHGWKVLWFDGDRPEEFANRARQTLEF